MTSRRKANRRQRKQHARRSRPKAIFEQLEPRQLLAAAAFNPGTLTLDVLLDNDQPVVVEADPNGLVLVDGAPVEYLPIGEEESQFVRASQVVNLHVAGDGNDNSLDLTGVTPTDYTSLANLDVDGGDGDDVVLLADLAVQQSVQIVAEEIDLGGNVHSGASQDYSGAMLLQSEVVLTADTGDIAFHGTIDAADNADAGSDFGLTVNTPGGNNIFEGEVGGQNVAGADPDGVRHLNTDATGAAGFTNLGMTAMPYSVLTAGNSQTYNDAVLLTADTVLQATTGDITFLSTIDAADNAGAGSDFSLTVNTPGGNDVFEGEVGGNNVAGLSDVHGLESFTTDAGTAFGVTILDITATPYSVLTAGNSQTYNSAVLLMADTVLQAATGNITFLSTIDAADNAGAGSDFSLTVNTPSGNNVFEGEVGGNNVAGLSDVHGLESLTTDAGTASGITVFDITATPNSVLTATFQTYNDAVLLEQDTVLQATSGNITFLSTIDAADNAGAGSDFSLTVNTPSGNNVFEGEVGGNNVAGSDVDGLESLTTDAGTVSGVTVIDITATPNSVLTATFQTYNDAVLLEQDTVLQATTGNITFLNTIDAADNAGAGSDFSLTVNTPSGNNVFEGEVGGNNVAGLSDVHGLESLTTDAGTVSGITVIDITATPNSVLTATFQTYNDAVLLEQDTVLQATTGNITFLSTIDAADNAGAGSDFSLTVNTPGGNDVFEGEVGGNNVAGLSDVHGLESFTTDAGTAFGVTVLNITATPYSVLTAGNSQTYNSAVLLAADTVLQAATGNITFLSTIDAADNAGAGSDFSLTVNTPSGNNVFEGEVGGNNVAGSDVDGLESLTTDAGTVSGMTVIDITATPNSVLTATFQTYNDAVLLEQDTVLQATTGNITFLSTIDAADNAGAGSDFSLTVNTPGGNNVFEGEVGGNNVAGLSDVHGLESLTTDAGTVSGITVIDITATPNSVLTATFQTYNDAVLLEQDTVLQATTGNITFLSTIDAADNAGAGSDFSLTVNTPGGNDVFEGEVGGNNVAGLSDVHGLESFTTDAGTAFGVTILDITATPYSVLTAGNSQTYNSAVLLAADTVLQAATGNITFLSTIDAADNAGAGSDFSLTVNTPSGNNVFEGEVGGNNVAGSDVDGLESLTTDAGTVSGMTVIDITATPNSVLTATFQTYNDAVLLEQDTVLQATTGNITFLNTIDAADNAGAGSDFSLTVNTPGGNNVFEGEVGGNNVAGLSDVHGLESLTTDAGTVSGITVIDITATPNSVLTATFQTYNDAVLLEQDTVLQATTGNITFLSTIDAADNAGAGSDFSLTVNTPGGNDVFEGEVGGNNVAGLSDVHGLESFTTDAGTAFGVTVLDITATPYSVLTAGNSQTYNSAVLLAADTVLQAATGNITFLSTIDAADNAGAGSDFSLTVNTPSGNNVFEGEVGGNNVAGSDVDGLESLTTDAGTVSGITVIDITATPNSVLTATFQTYNDAVLLEQDTVLQATTGNITFLNTIDAADNAGAGSDFSLTVNTPGGNNVFEGEVGGNNVAGLSDVHGLESLTTDAGTVSGITVIDITATPNSVLTATFQTYNDAVLLEQDTVLQATTGNITFLSTIDAADNAGAGSDFSLTVNTPGGNNVFEGEVGGNNVAGLSDVHGLEYLITDAGTAFGVTVFDITATPNSVLTATFQTYNDAVLLEQDTVLQATTDDITFHDTIDAADNGGAGSDYGLTVNTPGGDNVFEGEVGGNNVAGLSDVDGLGHMTTDAGTASGQTIFDIIAGPYSVLTSGNQLFFDAVMLSEDTFLRTSDGDMTFVTVVDSADDTTADSSLYGLTVERLNGSAANPFIFGGDVGGDNQSAPPFTVPSDPDGLQYLIVHANGPFWIIRDITTVEDIDIVVDSLLAGNANAPDDSLIVSPDTRLAPPRLTTIISHLGDIQLSAEDNITIENHTSIHAEDKQLLIAGDYRAPGNDPDPEGAVISVLGSTAVGDFKGDLVRARRGTVISGENDDDTILIDLERLRPRQVADAGNEYRYNVDGVADSGAQTTELVDFRTDHYDQAGYACSPTANYTQVTDTISIGDMLTLRDWNATGNDQYLLQESEQSAPNARVYQFAAITTSQLVDFAEIGDFNFEAGSGADSLLVRMPADGVTQTGLTRNFPVVHASFPGAGVGADDHVEIVGSPNADNLSVGIPSGGQRYPFEFDSLEFLRIRGDQSRPLGGLSYDRIVNQTPVRSLLEGDAPDDAPPYNYVTDAFNDLIIGGSNVDVVFSGPGSDAIFGGAGDDFLFADARYTGGSTGELLFGDAAVEFPGDSIDGGPPIGGDTAAQLGGLDSVANIGKALLDGGACKDVYTWLRAQFLFLGSAGNINTAAFDQLVIDAFTALSVNLRNMDGFQPSNLNLLVMITSGGSGEGGGGSSQLVWHNSALPADVNGDGVVSPRDALMVIHKLNEGNSSGSISPASSTLSYFDVNGDTVLSPVDALLVIHWLNHGSAEGEGEGEGELQLTASPQLGTGVPLAPLNVSLSPEIARADRPEPASAAAQGQESTGTGSLLSGMPAMEPTPQQATVDRVWEQLDEESLDELLELDALLEVLARRR